MILISGDAQSGWLNSAALRLLGAGTRTGTPTEHEWFALMPARRGRNTPVDVQNYYLGELTGLLIGATTNGL